MYVCRKVDMYDGRRRSWEWFELFGSRVTASAWIRSYVCGSNFEDTVRLGELGLELVYSTGRVTVDVAVK